MQHREKRFIFRCLFQKSYTVIRDNHTGMHSRIKMIAMALFRLLSMSEIRYEIHFRFILASGSYRFGGTFQ